MRFIICLIIGLLFIKPTLSKELLYSDEYIIDFLSENITKKKEEIINEIKYDSFKNIIIPLLTNDEYIKLNKIIDINFINRFVYGIDIFEEKINNNTYFAKSSFPLSNTQNSFDLLWRMCESYELWCKEVDKKDLIKLNITAEN